ncbi:hypothetical protein [Anaerocolumna aminovalerica]|uniref:hypothetical protein n=1 Tax=Anaerocolumna aminovalerica TaxID=1527 RepID=UPI001A9A5282|nr:hypothetical protein [Anaerocolumna aminovalerica]
MKRKKEKCKLIKKEGTIGMKRITGNLVNCYFKFYQSCKKRGENNYEIYSN